MTAPPRVPVVRTRSRPAPAPTEAPHPRIRARRVEVARDIGRRRRRRLNGVLGVVCAVVWSLVVVRSPILDVDRVQVDGARRTPPTTVVDASRISVGASMTELPMATATERIGDLPWIDEVHIRRMWPGTVRIVVTERRPVATMAATSGWVRLDAAGRILDRVARRPSLTVVSGTTSANDGSRLGPARRRVLATLERLPSSLRSEAVSATLGADGFEMALADGSEIVLGDAADLRAQLAAIRTVRSQPDTGECTRLDVRVPSAPSLTRTRPCA